MNRVVTLIALSSMLLGVQATVANAATHASVTRRQITDCMKKQMSANRGLSYNEATKTCKEQVKLQDVQVAANNKVPQ